MAENNTKPQLTDEEKIARKAKIFRVISRVLIIVAVVTIGICIYFAIGTKKNIDTQTNFDTQELRSKLKQIIALENKYKEEHGNYIGFKFQQIVKEFPTYDPNIEGNFKYEFNADTGVATGMEKDSSGDANGDGDGNDGLTLSVKGEKGVVKGSKGGDFFWPDNEK